MPTGSHPKKLIDLTGLRFGRLVVLGRAENGKCGAVRWLCRCDCGNEGPHFGGGLRSGGIASCGCVHVERFSQYGKQKRTHGLSRSKEQSAWRHMIARCYDPKNVQFKNYGARGVYVCQRWLDSFPAFVEDMGMAPDARHTLDRINTDGCYEPSNCRWVSQKTQQRNRRNNRLLTIDGETKCLAEWCEERAVPYARAHARLSLGWSPERALR